MKKLVMSLSLLLLAVPLFAVQQTNCERNSHECVGPQGPQGPQGEQGIPGVDGKDGIDGTNGVNGKDGIDGIDGSVGAKGDTGDAGVKGDKGDTGAVGATGEQGLQGQTGTDGKDGLKGDTGATGRTGASGTDGRDGQDVDEATVNALQARNNELQKRTSFANDAAAGAMATSSIDFGSTAKGETFIGAGVGYSHSWYGSSTAVGLGGKHGIEDDTAVILKAWSAGSNSYGAGLGATYKF